MRPSLLRILALGPALALATPAAAAPDRVRDRGPAATLSYNLGQGAQVDAEEVLVVFRNLDQEVTFRPAAEAQGCKRVRRFGRQPWVLYRCRPDRSLVTRFTELEKLPGVRWLEAGYVETLEAEPNDLSASQWYHHNGGQVLNAVRGVADADLNSRPAWDLTTGTKDRTIMILDVGIWGGHQDLAPNMWINPGENCGNGVDDDRNGYVDDCNGWDYGDDDNDPDPRTLPDGQEDGDECVKWHATMIAGLAGAAGNNGLLMTGINWNVSLMNWKKHRSSDCVSTTNASIEGVVYATENGADVISMSFSSSSYNATFEQALKNAEAAGVVAVSSGGNGGRNNDTLTRYPNEYDLANKLVVVNSDNRDQIYEGSNYGPNTVDLAAPGTFVVSTSIDGPAALSFGTGSSYSAGVAAGAVTLIWSAFPELTSSEIVQAIKDGAKRLPTMDCTQTARCIKLGARIDLFGAMGAAVRNVPPVLTVADPGRVELGDGDGKLEAGEQLELHLSLNNGGRSPAFGLRAVASASAPLSVLAGETHFGTIPAGASSDPNAGPALSLAIDPGCNLDQTVTVSLALTDHFGQSYTAEVPVELGCAPPPPDPDPTPDAGVVDPGPTPDPNLPASEDSGCRATHTGGPQPWAILAVALAFWLGRRR